jgi:GTP pyrophosphokinase
MELNASKGVAAHWRYKEGVARHDHLIKDEAWVEFIGELSKEERVSYEEFIARTRDTLLTDQVLVLSPRGEVVNLPRGSTPIDFAYYIHTELGHAIRSAKVNGAVVPLDYKLRNGDMVEVLKAEEPNPRPRPEWLVLAKSPKSLLKIRRYFKSLPRAERVEVGRGLLRQHIVKEGLFPLNLTANDKLLRLLKRLPVRSIDELYDKVALGQFQCDEIVEQLKRIHRSRAEAEEHAALAGKARGVPPTYALVGFATELGIQLAGGQPLRRKVELMACCTPVPGDHIYGIYEREERRVKAHRVECSLLKQALSQGDLIELGWAEERGEKRYPARIKIVSLNRVGMRFEILRSLSARNINLGGAEFLRPPTVVESDRNSRFELLVEVSDKAELAACLKALTELDDILEASRATRDLAAAPADGEA